MNSRITDMASQIASKVSLDISKLKPIPSTINLAKLSALKSKDIVLFCRQNGIVLPKHNRTVATERYTNSALASLSVYQNNYNIKSIDVGMWNMAMVELTTSFHLLNASLFSLSRNITRTMAQEYAKDIYHFTRDKSGIYLIEQQLQRHNISCAIIEAQLHAFLYPNTLSISPRSVGSYYGIASPKQLNMQPTNKVRMYNYKKKLGVEIIKQLLEKGVITATSQVHALFEDEKKKDDIADAVLNGIAYLVFSRRQLELPPETSKAFFKNISPLFNSNMFSRHEFEQEFMMSGHHQPLGRFIEQFRCYSMAMLARGEREELNYQGKIIMPPSALAKLASLHIEYPMQFDVQHPGSGKRAHAGVLEFIAEEGRVYLPKWMMNNLQAKEGDIIKVMNTTLPKGNFLKIQPQSVDFLNITDPKAVLERALRQYSALTQGNIISIKYNDKVYDLLCMEVKPGGNGISILETDLSVDFAPPVGYEEPQRPPRHTSTSSMASSISIDEHKFETSSKFSAFSGEGKRLSKRGSSRSQASPLKIDATAMKVDDGNPPAALRLPPGKLWFGFEVKPFKKDDENKPDEGRDSFHGAGYSLRSQ